MIRIYQTQLVQVENGETLNRVEIFCDSNETKPTDGVADGSLAIEVDTGNVYFFDEAQTDWVLQFSFKE